MRVSSIFYVRLYVIYVRQSYILGSKLKIWRNIRMENMKWKNHFVVIIGRTYDGRFPIIRLIEPIYNYGKIMYNIGTEIVVTDEELTAI